MSVQKHIANCDRYAARSTAGTKRKAELQKFSVHGAFRSVVADILGPVTLAKKIRATYILVMMDLLTKYAVTLALRDMTTRTVTNAIIDEWILELGAPDVVHTDQRLEFINDLMQDICRFSWLRKRELRSITPSEKGTLRD